MVQNCSSMLSAPITERSAGLAPIGVVGDTGFVPLPASGSPENGPIGGWGFADVVVLFDGVREGAFAETVPTPIADSATAVRISVVRSLLRSLVIGLPAPSCTETWK